MNMTNIVDLHANKVVLNTTDKIFTKWDCTLNDKLALLGLSEAEYEFLSKDDNTVNLSNDLSQRISYILNIYECLFVLFSNPENRDGFLNLRNNTSIFNGITPMNYMIKHGTISALSDVYNYLDSIRHH